MINVERYRLVPEALKAVPEHERNLFLAFGSVANEVLLLQKLILFSPPGIESEPLLQARLTHSLVLYRLLAGKLHEAWELLRKSYFGTRLSQTYTAGLNPESKAALRFLKKYHSGTNIVSRIRNEYAFHFPSEHFDQALRHPPGESLTIYMNPAPHNCLFYCSEQLVTIALIGAAPTEETIESMHKFLDEAIDLADYWLKFIGGYMTLFIARNRSALEDVPKSISVEGAPRLGDISIPWFISLDRLGGAPNPGPQPDVTAGAVPRG